MAFGLGILFASVIAVPLDDGNGIPKHDLQNKVKHIRKRQDAATTTGPLTSSPSNLSNPALTTGPVSTLAPTNISTSIPPPPSPSVVSAPTREASDTRSGPDPTVTANRAAMTPYLYACDKTQKAQVSQAWKEAGQLADAHAKWKPPGWFSSGSYQPAMDMYLGTDSAKDDPWFGTGKLKQNINRQQGIHTTNEDWSPYWSYAYIYCDESKVPNKPEKPKQNECSRPNTPGKKVMAYTFPDDGTIFGWNAKYVVLCPRFFEDEILTLEQQTNNAKTNTTLQKVMDPWRKVKARSLFHETYHWGPAEVSDPICNRKPEIYDAGNVVQLAKDENIEGSKINAESWAQAAMACYVQQIFNLKNPPVPNAMAAADVQGNFTDDIEEKFFDQAPDWFQSPVNLTAHAYSPPMDGVDILDVGGGSEPATPSANPVVTTTPVSNTATTAAPSSSPTPDMSSAVCQSCSGDLGASDCKPDDHECLINQCKADTNCQKCGLDCNQFGG